MKCTRAEIAAIFGVTPPAVDGWVRRGCPVAEPSQGRGRGKGAKFWAPDVVKWRDEHIVRAGADELDDNDSSAALRKRMLKAQTEREELELTRERDELMTKTQWAATVGAAFARVGARLRSAKPKLAAAAVGVSTAREGLARMEPIVEELLEELSTADDVPRATDADDADEAQDAA